MAKDQQIGVEDRAVHLLRLTQDSSSAQDWPCPDPSYAPISSTLPYFSIIPNYYITLFRTTKDKAYLSSTRGHLFHFPHANSSQEKQAATSG